MLQWVLSQTPIHPASRSRIRWVCVPLIEMALVAVCVLAMTAAAAGTSPSTDIPLTRSPFSRELPTSSPLQEGRRDVIPFDFGWRWSLGPSVPPTPSPTPSGGCEFPLNLTGVQCLSLDRVMGATTRTACAAAACDIGAEVWQWCRRFPGECQAPCFVGSADKCTTASNQFDGAGRSMKVICTVAVAASVLESK